MVNVNGFWPLRLCYNLPMRTGGYTVIEVLIVLSISSVVFLSAVLVFRGQSGGTRFTQSMHDLNSKIQSYANQVSSNKSPFSSAYSCAVSGVNQRPVLTAAPSGAAGTNEGCLFLGRALQVGSPATALYAYTVLGTRNQGGVASNPPATNFIDANPEPAIAADADLTEKYDLLWQAKGLSSKVTDLNGSQTSRNLVGFYSNFSASGGPSESQQLLVKGYNCAGGCAPKSATLQACVEELASGQCPSTPAISRWSLCIGDDQGTKTALIDIDSSSQGLTTNLSFVSCS